MLQSYRPLILVIVIVATGVAATADSRTERPVSADLVARIYEDGNILLTSGGADLESLPSLRMVDLAGATPERTLEVMNELLRRKHDGVFLGVPDGAAAHPPVRCANLVDHAKSVKRICKAIGSDAIDVSMNDTSVGTCDNGIRIALKCDGASR